MSTAHTPINTIPLKPALWQIPTPDADTVAALDEKIGTLKDRLSQIITRHEVVKFASSLAAEDMLMTDMLVQLADVAAVEVFTLQTGRLNAETLALIDAVQANYPKLNFTLYHPDADAVADYIADVGENGFYDSLENRKRCCHIRKIAPLNSALNGADAWLTGQRREQSPARDALVFAEHDSVRGIAKYNPIFDWSEADVWAYVLRFHIPFNDLYRQGYPSIGCEPCTIAVKAGAEIRSGRWWWESKDSKECGLHQ